MTFTENLPDLNKYTFELVPGLVGRIADLIESIDQWLKLKTGPILNGPLGQQEDWIDIYELRRKIPCNPKIELVRSWLYFHGIPHYKSSQTALFRRQEIEAWIEQAQRYGNGYFWTKKRKYREK